MGAEDSDHGAGAVGGYAGAIWLQAGEDVTFIDPWPSHVEHIEETRPARSPTPGTSRNSPFPVRALHVTGRAPASQGDADRHRLRVHEVLRHRLGHHADPAVSGT